MSFLDTIQYRRGKSQFKAERIDIYADMAEAIKDGEAIKTLLLNRIERADKAKHPIAVVYKNWLRGMATGLSLPDVAKPDIPGFDYLVLSSFERAGKIHEGMQFLSESLENLQEATSAMKSVLVGPGVVFTIAILIILLFSLYAIPLVADIYPPERWPMIGKILYTMSSTVKNYGILIGIGLVALVFLIAYSLDRLVGPVRKKLDHSSFPLPVYKIYRQVNGLNVIVAMASQLKVGVSLKESLRVIALDSSPYMKSFLNEIQTRLALKSDDFGAAFDVGLLDEQVLYRLVDFSRRSSFPEAVEKVGLQSFDRVTKAIKKTSATLGLIATVISGLLIGFIIVAFLFTAQGIQKDVQQQANPNNFTAQPR